MKKLATLSVILISILVLSCSSDDDEKVNYLDNSLIAGKWFNISGTDSTTYIFEKNKGYITVIDRQTQAEKENFSYGNYKITVDAIFFDQYPNTGLLYQVNANVLSIYQNKDNAWVKYTKK